MSMRRVSSRPRLVSDADFDFQNASLNLEEACIGGEEEEQSVESSSFQCVPSGGDGKDNFSEYATSCLYVHDSYDGDCGADNGIPPLLNNASPSLSTLEVSFKKTSLSSNEDEGASTSLTSAKRKRRSQQHYLTPSSSHAELQQHPLHPYNPPSSTHSHHQHQYDLTLQTLPEETLVQISTHLSYADIRSLASTSISIRAALLISTCAIESIWMEKLRRTFPTVFHYESDVVDERSRSSIDSISNNYCGRIHSKNINFVDEFHLPMAGVTAAGRRLCNSDSAYNRVNLPLLTGLLASRYPQEIDLSATSLYNGDDGLFLSSLFRSFWMNIPSDTHRTVDDNDDNNGPSVMVEGGHSVVTASVIQYTGRVGVGDRSIRSDKPFPPNCRLVIANNNGRSNINGGSSSSSLKSLSTWMKNHTPLRSRSHKRKNGQVNSSSGSGGSSSGSDRTSLSSSTSSSRHLLMSSSTPTSTATDTMATFPTTLSTPHPPSNPSRRNLLLPSTTPPLTPSQRSPLFRFISSLSHHCGSVSSSNNSSFVDNYNESAVNDNIDRTFPMEQHNDSFDGEDDDAVYDDDDDIGVNDYGMMIRSGTNGLLEQCRLKFGKMYDGRCNKSIKDNLRPFVIPTVVATSLSSSSGVGGGGDVTIDVTPRLVAYFEVTILIQQEDEDGNDVRRLPQQPQPDVSNRRNRPPPRPPRDIPRHNNHQLWGRMPHRVFPPINIPLPLFDPVFFAQLDAQERFAAQAGGAAPNFRRPPQLFHQDRRLNVGNFNDIMHHHQQRHDCVAIGLSTLSFNPRSKMPGWDEHSFGYHGDDGGIFHGYGDMLRRYGPSFGPGDTVGCGLEYSTRRIFFVKNGEFLGWAFQKIDKEMVERGLYPTVGVDTDCPIHVNFGQVPFKFDWIGFGREKIYE